MKKQWEKRLPLWYSMRQINLREFAENNNFTYIDPTKKLIKYVNDLPENFTLDQAVFLIVDSHMNKIAGVLLSLRKLLKN